jgi:hypothetical protein
VIAVVGTVIVIVGTVIAVVGTVIVIVGTVFAIVGTVIAVVGMVIASQAARSEVRIPAGSRLLSPVQDVQPGPGAHLA